MSTLGEYLHTEKIEHGSKVSMEDAKGQGPKARKEQNKNKLGDFESAVNDLTSFESDAKSKFINSNYENNFKSDDLSSQTIPTPLIFPSFEWHYDLSFSDNLLRILRTIQQELASHTQLHDWDEKLHPDPVKRIALFAKGELGRWGFDSGSHILNYSAVDEVATVAGRNYRQSIDPDSTRSNGYALRRGVFGAPPPTLGDAVLGPRIGYGRIV